jgi:hypothetical protein
MDAFGIYHFLTDPRGMDTQYNKNFCVATLENNGGGVSITLPTVPFGVVHNLSAMDEQESKRGGSCDMTSLALSELAAAVSSDKSRQTKTVMIHLPEGMHGCNEHLNGPEISLIGKGNHLSTKGRMLPYQMSIGNKKNGEFILTYVFWKIPIKNSIRIIDHVSVTNNDDIFNDAITSMYN